jgi:hypothetical protein
MESDVKVIDGMENDYYSTLLKPRRSVVLNGQR